MATHNDTGTWGEDLAVAFLTQHQYKVIEQNWTFQKGEIDIIAKKEGVLVFVEVKTRSNLSHGRPEQFISDKKMNLISQTAAAYMEEVGHEWEFRFDVISVIIKKDGDPKITHFEDAFFVGL